MKKAVCCIVCAIITAAMSLLLCLPAACLSYVRGDADGDGEVTSLDVTCIQRVITGIQPDPDGTVSRRGAIIDGTLTLMDATEIQRYLAGFRNRYHIGLTEPEDPTVFDAFPTEDNQLPIL